MRGMIALGCLSLLLAGPAAQAKDWLWEISMRSDIPGMAQMPGIGAHKQTLCISEGSESDFRQESQDECKVQDKKQSGKMLRMTLKCKDGIMKMEHETLSPSHWRSRMEMLDGPKSNDMPLKGMVVFNEGRRLGPCDQTKEGTLPQESLAPLGLAATQTKAMAAEMGKDCRNVADHWPLAPAPFLSYDALTQQRKEMLSKLKGRDGVRMADAAFPEVPECSKAKKTYCAKAKATLSGMDHRSGYATALRDDASTVRSALDYCWPDELAAQNERHCRSALKDEDIEFIAGHCPEARTALAKQHCAGRAYSSIAPQYQPLCGGNGGADSAEQAAETSVCEGQDPASMDLKLRVLCGIMGAYSESGKPAPEQPASGERSTLDKARELGDAAAAGARKLKGLFGF